MRRRREVFVTDSVASDDFVLHYAFSDPACTPSHHTQIVSACLAHVFLRIGCKKISLALIAESTRPPAVVGTAKLHATQQKRGSYPPACPQDGSKLCPK